MGIIAEFMLRIAVILKRAKTAFIKEKKAASREINSEAVLKAIRDIEPEFSKFVLENLSK